MTQPTAFPRGKRKSTTPSTAPSSKDNGSNPPSKKRATTTSSSTSAPSATDATNQKKGKDDFLFGNTDTHDALQNKKSRSSSSSSKHSHGDDELDALQKQTLVTSSLPLGGGAVLPPTQTSAGKRIPPKIEALTFSKFAKGTKVLGVLREVTEEYAVVSLPTMLTGFVRRDGAPLTKVLPPIHSIMAFYVLSTTTEEVSKRDQKAAAAAGKAPAMMATKKRRIELSPHPNEVNVGVRIDDYLRSASANSRDGSGSGGNSMMVVRGRIASVEDHGCIVDLGGVLSGGQSRAFLKFDEVEGEYEIDHDGDEDGSDEESEDGGDATPNKPIMDACDGGSGTSVKRKLNPNRVYDFTIHPCNISESSALPTILQLSLPLPSTLSALTTPSSAIPTLSSLQPGMLLSGVQVESYAKNGLCVAFKEGVYRGSVDEDHLGGHRCVDSGPKIKKLDSKDVDPNMWWKSVFKGKHAKFTARILAVDTATKIVRFSLNPHILALNGELAAFPHKVGSIIKNAQVIRVDPGIGALLALPTQDEDGADGSEEVIVKMDKELSNNLLSNSDYRTASKVHTAYVHISKSMDSTDKSTKKGKKGKDNNKGGKPSPNQRTSEALFARHFSLNSTIKSLRILSTSNLIDNIASCATAKSIVDAHVLTHADLKPGKVYKDVPVLELLESGGILVDLGVGTKGIVPGMHLFDKSSHGSIKDDQTGYRSKVRLAKYKVGNMVNVRCLTVDAPSRQCVLTAKKTLVANDIEDAIVDYTASIQVGKVAAGFISKVDDTGVTVTFYNNVHGRVTSRSLASELGVEDPKLNYTVGDVVMARVVDCVRRRNRHVSADEAEESMYYHQLKLSLKTIFEDKAEEDAATAADEEGTVKDGSAAVPLVSGSVLMPKRMKVLQLINCLHRDDGVFLPGYAVVAIKSKFLTGTSGGDVVECKLPYEQLLDTYSGDEKSSLSDPPVELDAIASKQLKVGKRIDAEGLILSIPYSANALPIVTLRPSLIATSKKQQDQSPATLSSTSIICPSPKSNLYMNQYVQGYVTRIDSRYGAFVRFLDGLTGLIPKLKNGLNETLYDSILCKVTALDVTSSPPKILLKKVTEGEIGRKQKKHAKTKKGGAAAGGSGAEIQVGDVVGDVKVADINFARAKVYLLSNQYSESDSSRLRARIHVTMASPMDKPKTKLSKKEKQYMEEHKITKHHPFYNWKEGDVISNVKCVAVDVRSDGVSYVELANVVEQQQTAIVTDPKRLPPGSVVSAIVTSISTAHRHGIWVQVCPGMSGFISALELSDDADVLNDLTANYKVGSRITCVVMEAMVGANKKGAASHTNRRDRGGLQLTKDDHDATKEDEHQALELSVLLVPADNKKPVFKPTKPQRGNVVIGRINTKSLRKLQLPSLTLNLRGNFVGRCCITELSDVDGWENMPLGKTATVVSPVLDRKKASGGGEHTNARVVSSDSDADHSHGNNEDESDDENKASGDVQNDYPDGKYVKCRVLGAAKSKGIVELSLRDSRLGEGAAGNLEDDPVPNPNEMAHAYVVSTTKMGCFVRLSRSVEGRVILKELSDDFIPNPSAMFPPGRLVVGKVKNVKESTKKGGGPVVTMVDMDMRESVLLTSGDRLSIDDIQENSKYTGVISRVESYGVFVRIDNSDVSGLAHVSECSDAYIKNIFDLYNPGDFVKLMVVNMDKEKQRLGFSLKASNFEDDSDDESSSSSSDSDSDAMEEDSDGEDDKSIDSEDEDFAAKLAKKMEAKEDGMDVDDDESTDGDDSSEDSSSHSESDSSDSEDDELEEKLKGKSESLGAMDTNVGFDWGANTSKSTKSSKKLAEESSDDESSSSSSEDESDDDDDDADSGFKSSHKARKKAAAKRREEEETSRRESALADGTADETPETSADFERLVASSPNSSEVWIKYMAFFLSLADIASARNVANRAFERIEFRQEGEKLNVWTALLTLELKYGTDKSLHETVDRACQQNNPKQVYLRVCELLDKEVDASASGSADLDTSTKRADEMFKKMCKKFKSKKSVWLAHFQYLLKGSRHEEAHALLKRSLQSLPNYKHVEVMSKFAQMEFELGSPERGRTIFNALLEKHPKRMDLLFVNIDKEVKNGDVAKARALLDSVVNPVSNDRKFKFSDKQMKSLFKKWYRMEEDHGDEESQERVKEEARSFVAKTTA